MRIQLMCALISVALSATAWAQFDTPEEAEVGVSAIRQPGESWEAALDRETQIVFPVASEDGFTTQSRTAASARQLSRYYDPNMDISALPYWTGSEAELHEAFRYARDERPYRQRGKPNFARRAPWLYPVDGCYARAEHLAQSIERRGQTRPGKVFAFGHLRMDTKYDRRGRVFWSYHMAAGYRFNGGAYVFDPAVDPSRPLRIDEWLSRIGKGEPTQVRVSFCDTNAYIPSNWCFGSRKKSSRTVPSHLAKYLIHEWNRLVSLRMRPERLLGDQPPW